MSSHRSNLIPIIFDTDMDLDVDDVGALAVLHALMDLGETKILGIICDVPIRACAECVIAINNFYDRKDLPVGIVMDEDYKTAERYRHYRKLRSNRKHFKLYNEKIAKDFFPKNVKTPKIRDATSLYRELLSKSEDSTVIIAAVGLLTALSKLLDSKPDEYSPLSGIDLVKQKVKTLITMGIGLYPKSKDIFNWIIDWESAVNVIERWPTRLVIQPLGSQFLTGKTLPLKTPKSNPVRISYELIFDGNKNGNFSWDLITALYAVRGAEPYFEEQMGYKLIMDSELGKNHWEKDKIQNPPHIMLSLKGKRLKVAKELESLLVQPPKNKMMKSELN